MKPETSQELRRLVREVLKEAMANRAAPKQGTEAVRIGTDVELQAFIARLSSPGVIETVRSGKLRFALVQPPPVFTSTGDVLEGVVSEQRILSLAQWARSSGSHRRSYAAGPRQGPQTWSEN